MIPWLLDNFSSFVAQHERAAGGGTQVYLTARVALAALTSFLAALLLGPVAIRWLTSRYRERIDSASVTLNELHAHKQNTPTMGGLFLVTAIVVATLLCGDLTNSYTQLCLCTVVSFGLLGCIDDYVKLSSRQRGLSARGKFVIQCGLAVIITGWLYAIQRNHPLGTDLVWPVGGLTTPLGWCFIPWGVFLLVGSSNSVNLTDGLDGLASGCLIAAGSAFLGLSYLGGHRELAEYLSLPHFVGGGEVAVVLSSMVGAVLGFLWYNCHPAQVFMGDAGSLPLGALLGLAALITRQEILLAVIGGVFVIETLSVIYQVTRYRITGKKPLLCSPLHNHFVFAKVPESRIVTRFWITSALLAIAGLASLKLR